MNDLSAYSTSYTASTVSAGLIFSQLLGGMSLAQANENSIKHMPVTMQPAYQLEVIDSSNDSYPISYEIDNTGELLQEIDYFYSNLLSKQQSLGPKIENLLFSNLENLYES